MRCVMRDGKYWDLLRPVEVLARFHEHSFPVLCRRQVRPRLAPILYLLLKELDPASLYNHFY